MIKKLSFLDTSVNCVDYKGLVHNVADSSIINKINEIIALLNVIVIDVDGTKCIDGSKKAEPAELDMPKSYKNDQLTLATLDYSKKLEKENSELKDKLEHITDILYESKYALEEIINPSCISHEQQMAQEALDKVNAEIKAITGEQ